MNNCNSCSKDPCGCNKCEPARYSCGFNIYADPFDATTWIFDNCGQTHRVKIPKIAETCTNLSTNFSTSELIYNGECGTTSINGHQLGQLINLNDLRDVEVTDADSCDLMVFDPGCTACGDGCKPKPAMWRKYHIPDAEDCEIEPDDDGYYHVLIKDDCGCIKECRLPVVPNGSISVDFTRDSVPDDPDFPWYYGQYNDRINLHLQENASEYFGKYDLEVTVNYGIQAVLSSVCKNVNFRSLVVPVIEGQSINVSKQSSILQGWSMFGSNPDIPWGTCSMRGSFTFIVPKGKEAYLHHEYRLRTNSSFPSYYTNAEFDGKRCPDEEASKVNNVRYNVSRLNALQLVIKPARGSMNFNPVTDVERNQLDPAVDEYPSVG